MNRALFLMSLLMTSFGAAVVTSAFLPKRGDDYTSYGKLDHYFRSRVFWDVPVAVFLGALLVSFGIYLLLEARGGFKR